jgi:hypothetical protein
MGLFLVLVSLWCSAMGPSGDASALRRHSRFGAFNSSLGPCEPGSSPPASGAPRPVFLTPGRVGSATIRRDLAADLLQMKQRAIVDTMIGCGCRQARGRRLVAYQRAGPLIGPNYLALGRGALEAAPARSRCSSPGTMPRRGATVTLPNQKIA